LIQTAITRLYFDEDQSLVGYFTLFNDMVQVGKQKSIKHWAGFLPKSELSYFPAVRLHYLGVDKRHRKKGYGRDLMYELFYISRDITKLSGCNFITVEALNNSVPFYRVYFGFIRIDRKPFFEVMVLKIEEVF
jgi:GNAT superfamily N-acetyltransferase